MNVLRVINIYKAVVEKFGRSIKFKLIIHLTYNERYVNIKILFIQI